MIPDTALGHPWRRGILTTVLAASIPVLVASVRSGSFLFHRPLGLDSAEEGTKNGMSEVKLSVWIVGVLLATAPLLVVFDGNVMAYINETVVQLQQVPAYIEAVMENANKRTRK